MDRGLVAACKEALSVRAEEDLGDRSFEFAAQAVQLFARGYVTDANGSTLFSRIALTGIIHVLRTAQCDSLAVRGEGHRNHPGAVRAWRRYAHDFLAGRDFPDAKN